MCRQALPLCYVGTKNVVMAIKQKLWEGRGEKESHFRSTDCHPPAEPLAVLGVYLQPVTEEKRTL